MDHAANNNGSTNHAAVSGTVRPLTGAEEVRTIAFRNRSAREATDAALRWMQDPLLSEGFHIVSIIVMPKSGDYVATVSYRG